MLVGWWKLGGMADEEGVKCWVGCLESVVVVSPKDEEGRMEVKDLMLRETFLPVLGETLSLLIGESRSLPLPLKRLVCRSDES
jgi:hypothetical protein